MTRHINGPLHSRHGQSRSPDAPEWTKLALARTDGEAPVAGGQQENLILGGKSERVSAIVDVCVSDLMQKHHVPGASVAFVHGGEVAWHKEFGVRCAGKPEKIDENSRFEACSMTKPLVTYAALRLVESGTLDLDKPLVKYLDDMEALKIRKLFDQELFVERITARMVITHTTGLPNWRDGKALQVQFEPGTKFGYSGEGFMYLQHVLEHILKKPLDLFVKESLLDPIGMTSSSLVWRDGYERLVAAGHDENGAVRLDQPRNEQPAAAYSLLCTPTDYARFLIEMMKEDRSAPHSLGKEMLQQMLSPHTKVPDHTAYAGCGWFGQPTSAGVDRICHGGSNGSGHRCLCEFYPQSGSGIVVMTNADGGGKLIMDLMANLREPLQEL